MGTFGVYFNARKQTKAERQIHKNTVGFAHDLHMNCTRILPLSEEVGEVFCSLCNIFLCQVGVDLAHSTVI